MQRIRSGFEPFDVEARETHVARQGQRIAPMPHDEMPQEARDLAEAVRITFGVTEEAPIPDIFATMFKHPGVYRGQMQMGVELNKLGELPPRDRELAILRVAWLCRSPFEWGEHVTIGKHCGLSGDDIERVTQGSDATGWNVHDRAVLRAAEELLDDYAMADETWDVLARSWSDKQLIEMTALVGAYAMTAMLYNTMRFELLEGNGGLRQR